MGKYVSALGLLATFAFGIWFVTKDMKPKDEQDQLIGFGFGPAANGNVPMQLAVTFGMMNADPPQPDSGGFTDHFLWIDEHFELLDANGQRLPWQRKGTSELVQGVDASIAECFIGTQLQAGQTYTFTYTSNVADGFKYRCEIIPPNDTMKSFQRYHCKRVFE